MVDDFKVGNYVILKTDCILLKYKGFKEDEFYIITDFDESYPAITVNGIIGKYSTSWFIPVPNNNPFLRKLKLNKIFVHG